MKDLEDFEFPSGLKYSSEHVWISGSAPYKVGISDYAQFQIRGLNFIELPETGQSFAKGAACGNLESRKRVSQLYCPVDGKVTAINEALSENPRLVKDDPYGRGWMFEIEPAVPEQLNSLMDAGQYLEYLKKSV